MVTLSKTQSFKAAVLLILSFAVLVGGAAGCSTKPKPAAKKPEPEESGAKFFPKVKPSAIAGRSIYDSKCAKCHGPTGSGDGTTAVKLHLKPAGFTDTKFIRSELPQDLFEALTNGQKRMPKFKKKLTTEQRWNVLFYAWSLQTSPMQIAAGKNIYDKNCLSCHGKLGDGKGPKASGLKTKPPKFNDPEFMMKEKSTNFFETLTKGEKPMPAFKNKLTEDQRWSAIDYIWTFVYTPPAQ